jgi:hypothetical protein
MEVNCLIISEFFKCSRMLKSNNIYSSISIVVHRIHIECNIRHAYWFQVAEVLEKFLGTCFSIVNISRSIPR